MAFRQQHRGQSSLSFFMQESAEIGGIKDWQAKQAAKVAQEIAELAPEPEPADEHWQDAECACYELPDGRQHTCPACTKRQRDEDLADYFEVYL